MFPPKTVLYKFRRTNGTTLKLEEQGGQLTIALETNDFSVNYDDGMASVRLECTSVISNWDHSVVEFARQILKAYEDKGLI